MAERQVQQWPRGLGGGGQPYAITSCPLTLQVSLVVGGGHMSDTRTLVHGFT